MDAAIREARRALTRLQRAVEKVEHELGDLEGALRHAEAEDFPEQAFEEVRQALARVTAFAEEEGERLEEKILHAGGLEPGRVRRS